MTALDIKLITSVLGIDGSLRGSELLALCPMHEKRTGKADHSPSWSVNLITGMHMCFSCGYKGNLIQLVCDVNGFYTKLWGYEDQYDYKAAEEWIATVAEISPEKMLEMLRSLPDYIAPLPKPVEMSDARLAVFVEPPQEALDSRNITSEAVAHYGVLWNAETKTWILPVREPHFNKLLGWQEKGTVERTFMNRPPGMPKSKTLFGIENQQEDIAVVVESPLDCLRMFSAGVKGAVAICGANISEDQIKLLRYSDRIIAALDTDAAGRKGNEELRKAARKYGLNLFFFNYGDTNKKDPGDMTNEEILWGIVNAKSYILGESAYVQGNPQALSS